MKKISIIVPIYNIVDYLERILDSLLEQTYSNLEIILIDDGSSDGSEIICDRYKNKDKRIKVVHQKNSGVSIARNVGLKLATGDYIGFVDSDDIIDKNMYKKLYDNMIKYNCEISVCNFCSFTDKPLFTCSDNIRIYSREEALKDIISDGVITNFLWNKVFLKSIFDDIKFPEHQIYEDMYVMPKLIEKINKLCYDESKLYGYFIRSSSYVNTYNMIKNKNYLDFSDQIYGYLNKYLFLTSDLKKYRTFYIYSAFLQAVKSNCDDIINCDYMLDYYKLYKKDFTINNKYQVKRKLLMIILYLNKNLFYLIVRIINKKRD